MSEQFRQWLTSEMENRHYSQRALARAIGISHPYVSRILSGENSPSVDFCIKVASTFNESPEKVLRLAGILPSLPASDDDPTLREAIETLQNLPAEQRKDALKYLRFLSRSVREEKGE